MARDTGKIVLHKSKAANVLLSAKKADKGLEVLLTCTASSLNAYLGCLSNTKYFQSDPFLTHH